MASGDPKVEKIQSNFQKLSAVASSLNSASDELTKVVAVLDETIRNLNIGLTVWINFTCRVEQPPEYDNDQIGYCKLNGKWGIALQRVWGDYQSDYYQSDGPWLFNDAPRDMRLKSVDKIPDLIEALGKEAFETTRNVHEKTQQVRELANAIQQVVVAEKTGIKPPPPLPSPKWAPLDPTPAETATTILKPMITPFEPAPQGLPTIGELARGKKGGK